MEIASLMFMLFVLMVIFVIAKLLKIFGKLLKVAWFVALASVIGGIVYLYLG